MDDFMYGFEATNNFAVKPHPERVLLYWNARTYVVDIQSWTKQGDWRDEPDPFRSTDLAECVEYYEELLKDETYTDIRILK